MIKVENGKVVMLFLPTTGKIDCCSISNYNLLPLEVLLAEGWLPSENNIPDYNEETQSIQHDSYTILKDKVIVNYVVMDGVDVVQEISLAELIESATTLDELKTALLGRLSELKIV